MTVDHAAIVGALQTLSAVTDDTAESGLLDVIAILSSDDLAQLHDAADVLKAVIEEQWADRDDPTECENCATRIARDNFGRPRKFCSDACRQSAYRSRHR